MSKTVLITGTTSGIGSAFAEKFAKEGYRVLLVARNEALVRQQALDLQRRFTIETDYHICHLEQEDAVKEILHWVKQQLYTIDVVVNNAGFNVFGKFLTTNQGREEEMLAVHMKVPTALMKAFLPQMVKRGTGSMLNISSTGAYMPCPNDAVYAASKAYLLSLSKAVHRELKHSGVSVTAVCPGSTKTHFASKAGMETTRLFQWGVLSPEKVALKGYQAMKKQKAVQVVGGSNQLLVAAASLLPDWLVQPLVEFMMST